MNPIPTPEQMLNNKTPEGMELVRTIDEFDDGGPTIVVYRDANITQEDVAKNRRKALEALETVVRSIALRQDETV